jgi:hypothetical protein
MKKKEMKKRKEKKKEKEKKMEMEMEIKRKEKRKDNRIYQVSLEIDLLEKKETNINSPTPGMY